MTDLAQSLRGLDQDAVGMASLVLDQRQPVMLTPHPIISTMRLATRGGGVGLPVARLPREHLAIRS